MQEAYIVQGRVALDYFLNTPTWKSWQSIIPTTSPEMEGGMFGRAHAPLDSMAGSSAPTSRIFVLRFRRFAPFGMMLDLVDLIHFLSFTRSFDRSRMC